MLKVISGCNDCNQTCDCEKKYFHQVAHFIRLLVAKDIRNLELQYLHESPHFNTFKEYLEYYKKNYDEEFDTLFQVTFLCDRFINDSEGLEGGGRDQIKDILEEARVLGTKYLQIINLCEDYLKKESTLNDSFTDLAYLICFEAHGPKKTY